MPIGDFREFCTMNGLTLDTERQPTYMKKRHRGWDGD